MKKEKSFFYKQVKKIMAERALTQQELANKIGVTQTMISHWMNGDSLPTFSSLKKIAKALDVSINYFIESNISDSDEKYDGNENNDKNKDILYRLNLLEEKNKRLETENILLKKEIETIKKEITEIRTL